MKKLKIKSLKVVLNLVLVVILFPACSQPSHTDQSSVASESKPEMDIHAAVMSSNLEVVRQHIEAGTDLNIKEPFSGSTPLITAATFDKKEIAKALIEGGADLTISNNDGSTPLHSAAFFGRVEIVQMLIDAKVDKTLRNNYGATAMESVAGPFADVKPIYEMMQQQLEPLGLQLDMVQLEKTRPVIVMMLQ